jgi:peptidase E
MSTKYILVGGYIQNAPDKGEGFCLELIQGVTKESVKILDCIFARPKEDWENTIVKDNEFFSKYIISFELILADPENFTDQVREADIIFLRGGFTLPLMETLSKDTGWIKELNGKVVAGTSAGAEVIAKYYHVLKTNRTGDGLGLLPIKFIPHWKSNFFDAEPQNLDWEKILQELKEYKEDLPIVTLAEGEFKVFHS